MPTFTLSFNDVDASANRHVAHNVIGVVVYYELKSQFNNNVMTERISKQKWRNGLVQV